MKNYLSISFAAFYLLISMGVGLQLHFCGEQVAEVALYAQEEKHSCCPTETPDAPLNDCCHNQAIVFQSATETIPQKFKISFTSQSIQPFTFPKPRLNFTWLKLPEINQDNTPKYSPPPQNTSGKNLRIACQSLVLYA